MFFDLLLLLQGEILPDLDESQHDTWSESVSQKLVLIADNIQTGAIIHCHLVNDEDFAVLGTLSSVGSSDHLLNQAGTVLHLGSVDDTVSSVIELAIVATCHAFSKDEDPCLLVFASKSNLECIFVPYNFVELDLGTTSSQLDGSNDTCIVIFDEHDDRGLATLLLEELAQCLSALIKAVLTVDGDDLVDVDTCREELGAGIVLEVEL